MALIDFTLSKARQFYLSMGNPLGWKGLISDLNNLSDYIKSIASGNWKVDNILVSFQSAGAAGTPTPLHSILWITIVPIFDDCLLSLLAKCKNHLILSC